MRTFTSFSKSFFLRGVFIVSLFVLAYITVTSYKHTNGLSESGKFLVHSYRVKAELGELLSLMKEAETGQRGYIITRDISFLRPFYDAPQKVNKNFNDLRQLTKGNTEQQTNLDSLKTLIRLRFKFLWHSLEEEVADPLYVDKMHMSMVSGKIVMDQIRMQINKMSDLEIQNLHEQQEKYEDETFLTPLFTFLLLLFSILVFTFSFFKINQDLEILRKSNETLLLSREIINHAEEIGSFSCWQWDVGSNKLIYSDNQYHLLGCEPQSFEPTIENFLEFVHIRDRRKVLDNSAYLFNENKPSTIFFRVIRKDGKLRYFKSVAKLLTEKGGKKILIGVNSDVTEQYLSNVALEDRNQELENSNRELASFNHIASHDLQEPLRKIQTFISRIGEKEDRLSDSTKEYFARIQVSATRMRKLIDDLLLFSRINKVEKVFERLDLNDILEHVKQELAQEIEDKKAVIEIAPLPVLNIIPFQVQQLFVNLIGNSLKYSGNNPLIQIKSEVVTANFSETLKSENPRKRFYKISVSDNGLGFDPQYAESIFDPFYRLHNASEYPGTGIGLAICKKIIENHHGYIEAEGQPNEGAVFSIFLPYR